jgi:hypothetical protein
MSLPKKANFLSKAASYLGVPTRAEQLHDNRARYLQHRQDLTEKRRRGRFVDRSG